MIVRAKPQLLILDEPTNHLDIEMREALAEALQDFDGALVVVAHDRHLLTATTDAFWLVHDGRVAPFDGDLDDYRDWALAANRRDAKVGSDSTFPFRPGGDAGGDNGKVESDPTFATIGSRQAQKRAEAEARQARHARRKPLRRPSRRRWMPRSPGWRARRPTPTPGSRARTPTPTRTAIASRRRSRGRAMSAADSRGSRPSGSSSPRRSSGSTPAGRSWRRRHGASRPSRRAGRTGRPRSPAPRGPT